MRIDVDDTTDEEIASVKEYVKLHMERFGIGKHMSDYDNQWHDEFWVSANGGHEDGLLDTHVALKVLNSLR